MRYRNLAGFDQSALDRALPPLYWLTPLAGGYTELSPVARSCQGAGVETAGSLTGPFPPFGVTSIASAPGVVGPMKTRSSSDLPVPVNRAAAFSSSDR
jgi:hypothetical protein